METQGSTDYQVVRDFISELESSKPERLADVPQEKIDRFWDSLFRVYPARMHMERVSPRAESALMFILGAATMFIGAIVFNGIMN